MRSASPARAVALLGDFREDRRASMDVYVHELASAFRTQADLGYRVEPYIPRLPASVRPTPTTLRLARYLYYPWAARRVSAELHHIAEPGYSQLLYAFDRRRTVITVHDVAPMARWRGGIAGVDRGRRPWLNAFSAAALKRAAHLIVISEHTRREVLRYCGCDPAKLTVIYHGIEHEYRALDPAAAARARSRWDLPDDGTRRVLVTGSGPRKNLTVALEAFAQLLQSGPDRLQLVGVGVASPEWRACVDRLKLGPYVREIAWVPPGEMVEIYNGVDVLFFPSRYEGFGRPPLEAMACGVPVMASSATAVPEAVGDAGLMCPPDDVRGFARGLHRLLFDGDLRGEFIARGLVRARQFTWEEAARQTARVYDVVLGRSASRAGSHAHVDQTA